MSIFVQDADFTLHHGDCLDVLREMEAGSVHCCVTSPPYWGLRDYGTGRWEGGNPDHKHDTVVARNGRGGSGSPGKQTEGAFPSHLSAPLCSCGATFSDPQLGLEATPDEYVARMVAVFAEVRRVLRDDGTLWLNLGDSYAAANRTYQVPQTRNANHDYGESNATIVPDGLKPKDLVGIPWRVAFALQADGWYLRSDIIWSKPNPMPESVTDRPTKAHEYVFLLSKSARYFYDAEALREKASYFGPNGNPSTMDGGYNSRPGEMKGRAGVPWQERKSAGATAGNLGVSDTYQNGVHGSGLSHELGDGLTRNARSVWEIQTQPYPDAHFATFPLELPRRCIKAGTPLGGTVLDPFMGSGTTALVARQLERQSVGIELNADYCALAAKRLAQLSLLVT